MENSRRLRKWPQLTQQVGYRRWRKIRECFMEEVTFALALKFKEKFSKQRWSPGKHVLD